MFDHFNEKLTLAAVRLDQWVGECSLLSIPARRWKLFVVFVYAHVALAALLFLLGITCFCLGMQYSAMYTEVNCTDGTNIWIPLLNMMVSFGGLLTLRTLQLHWPAFIYALGLCLMTAFMCGALADFACATARWASRRTPRLDPWATNFSALDLILSLLAAFSVVVYAALLMMYGKYWCRRSTVDSHRATQTQQPAPALPADDANEQESSQHTQHGSA